MRQIINYKIVFIILLFLCGCTAPPLPAEIKMAAEQDYNLWKAGVQVYAPAEYNHYKSVLRQARDGLLKEESRFVWFQNYKTVQSSFQGVLKIGSALQDRVEKQKNSKKNSIAEQICVLRKKIDTLRGLTGIINEGRLARRDLARAELLLSEATSRYERNDYLEAEARMKNSSQFITAAEETLIPIFKRYADRDHVKNWQRMVRNTVTESRTKGVPAIIVDKSRRLLTLYQNGAPFRTYNVGLGRNGFLAKLSAGDNSTPEGEYRVIRKNSASRFHKALLINYPNEDDRKSFERARKKGLIPAKARIGGLIEIHGGGEDSMTYGCVALNNKEMDSLFKLVPVGTRVTIVGAVDYDNCLSSAIEGL